MPYGMGHWHHDREIRQGIVQGGTTSTDLQSINWCRMWLQVNYLPKICMGNGKNLHKWHGKEWRKTLWGTNGQEHRSPHRQSGKLALDTFGCIPIKYLMSTPEITGPLVGTQEPTWCWYLNKDIPILYQWDGSSWTYHVQIPQSTRWLQFTSQATGPTQNSTTNWQEWDIAMIRWTQQVITVTSVAQQEWWIETVTQWDENLLAANQSKQWQLEISEQPDVKLLNEAFKATRQLPSAIVLQWPGSSSMDNQRMRQSRKGGRNKLYARHRQQSKCIPKQIGRDLQDCTHYITPHARLGTRRHVNPHCMQGKIGSGSPKLNKTDSSIRSTLQPTLSCPKLRQSLPMTSRLIHMKGHQDMGIMTVLSKLAWMNIEMWLLRRK